MLNVRQALCVIFFIACGYLASKVEPVALIASILLGTAGMFLAFGQDALHFFSTIYGVIARFTEFKSVPMNSVGILLVTSLVSFFWVDVRILGSPIISTFLFWIMTTLIVRENPAEKDEHPEIRVYAPFLFAGLIIGTLLRTFFRS